MSAEPKPQRRILPEVQALRAVAVLLVLAYHLAPHAVPGGFIGVDVFFAISGFLITGHLLREVRRTGRIDLPGFWAARMRRILPAAIVVVLAVLAATLAFLPSTQWKTTGVAALASVLSVENWVLAADSVDYLAADSAPTALNHFWSLGVEEQFYLAWPLLVLLAVWLGGLRRGPAVRGGAVPAPGFPRTALLLVFGAVVAASLSQAMVLVGSGNPAAYFVTPARVWELAAGGLLALLMHGPVREPGPGQPEGRWFRAVGDRNTPARTVLAWAGLAAIGVAALGYGASTPFPGLSAALPVAGTLAVILAGKTRGAAAPRRVLELPPVQWVGDVSYSLYLWHWPVLIFFVNLAGGEPNPLQGAGLLVLSLLLAAASHRWVETPLRSLPALASSRWRTLGAGAAVVVLAGSFSFVPGALAQRETLQKEEAAATLLAAPPSELGAASIPEGAPPYLPGRQQIVPVPAEAERDRPHLGDCVQKPDSTVTRECAMGTPDGTLTVALVGDSHATHWFKALEATARERGWTLLTYLKNSCPFTATERVAERRGGLSCHGANEQTLDRIISRGDVDAVVTSHWAGAILERGAAQGFADYWGRLEDAGIKVYPIIDTPRPGTKLLARDCVVQHPRDLEVCGTPEAGAFEPDDFTREAAALEPRVGVLDLSDQFCLDGFCPVVIGNVLVYRDKHHVSDTYMRTLAPVFGARLGEKLRADGLGERPRRSP
ncbi:acyltransferase family protein [Paeniglutamicibacter sp. R2-26]|uniref:acyltransferase family protein n=1 Tax=Paeniglutamicibacter sp. R2-26 TaxID=3144417 RepID=UPI003EE70C3A